MRELSVAAVLSPDFFDALPNVGNSGFSDQRDAGPALARARNAHGEAPSA
jgi:hypothetical protein